MLKLALTNYPKFAISEYELTKGGPSLTIDTIRFFQSKYPSVEFYLIMGEDSFDSITSWHSFKEIFSTINIIVYPRENYCFKQTIINKFPDFKEIKSDIENISKFSTLNKNSLFFLNLPFLKGSSTQARLDFKEEKTCFNLIPPEVIEYI